MHFLHLQKIEREKRAPGGGRTRDLQLSRPHSEESRLRGCRPTTRLPEQSEGFHRTGTPIQQGALAQLLVSCHADMRFAGGGERRVRSKGVFAGIYRLSAGGLVLVPTVPGEDYSLPEFYPDSERE